MNPRNKESQVKKFGLPLIWGKFTPQNKNLLCSNPDNSKFFVDRVHVELRQASSGAAVQRGLARAPACALLRRWVPSRLASCVLCRLSLAWPGQGRPGQARPGRAELSRAEPSRADPS